MEGKKAGQPAPGLLIEGKAAMSLASPDFHLRAGSGLFIIAPRDEEALGLQDG